MTEMAHGTMVVQSGEAILPRWWRTVDRVTIGCVLALFAIGILLGFAASPSLAARNDNSPFHYVNRQAAFGTLALITMFVVSMASPTLIRRFCVIALLAGIVSLALLPLFGTDFGTGGVRWYSLGFASVQP
ncbi:MAG: FtsW/RodA/SpoVE family cell cycle protein, partial [Pseudomonadota bacterium]